ncbi:hypothetical protein BKA70DRAFT_1230825 [Coprinopsis sp. MPI-PUGE-AT-0042]|nr:hypothetical protein BKA70DRAFT_1230825 [Coprinopsis sp. MPI-PUGE-AT-0042]
MGDELRLATMAALKAELMDNGKISSMSSCVLPCDHEGCADYPDSCIVSNNGCILCALVGRRCSLLDSFVTKSVRENLGWSWRRAWDFVFSSFLPRRATVIDTGAAVDLMTQDLAGLDQNIRQLNIALDRQRQLLSSAQKARNSLSSSVISWGVALSQQRQATGRYHLALCEVKRLINFSMQDLETKGMHNATTRSLEQKLCLLMDVVLGVHGD